MSLSITCVDTMNYEKSIHAIKRTVETLKTKVDINRIYWYSDKTIGDNVYDIPVKHITIPKMKGQPDYSFHTLKNIPQNCTEDFDIIVQWDGYAVNAEAWTDDFFQYDYIGATWDDGVVGNGGFSWRSKKLYDAFIDADIKHLYSQYDTQLVNRPMHFCEDRTGRFVPEDVVICRLYKDLFELKYKIKYAPTYLADRFSVENHSHIAPWTGKPNEWVGKSLGFHGKYGILSLYNL